MTRRRNGVGRDGAAGLCGHARIRLISVKMPRLTPPGAGRPRREFSISAGL